MSKSRQNNHRCKILGISIKKVRVRQSLSQEQLAEKAEVHTSYIGQIERGLRYPSLKVLFRVADALNIKLAELLADVDGK